LFGSAARTPYRPDSSVARAALRSVTSTSSAVHPAASSAVTSASPGAVQLTAQQLHQTLQKLINEHAGDPEVARRAAQLLQAEISLLEVHDPAGASQVLAQARNLVTLLQSAAPPRVRASVQPLLDAVSTPSPSAKAASPKPKPTTASPTPRATSTSPSASSTPGTTNLP
jgi:hypothetical protein